MQFKKIAFLIISSALFFTACDSKKEETKEVKIEQIKKEENKITLTSIHNENLTLSKVDDKIIFENMKDKIILLNFFATWCPPCKAEIPHLVNLKNKYKDSFEIIAINVGDRDGVLTPLQQLIDFANEYKINYTITNSPSNFNVADLMGGVRNIPTMFMLDKEGKVIQKYVGIVPEEMMETDIKRALGK